MGTPTLTRILREEARKWDQRAKTAMSADYAASADTVAMAFDELANAIERAGI